MRAARKNNQQGEPSLGGKEYSRSPGSQGGDRGCHSPNGRGRRPGNEAGEGKHGEGQKGLWGSEGARGRVSRKEGIQVAVVSRRTLRPQAIPPERAGSGPPQLPEKGHSGPRAPATVSRVGGASHLGSGAAGTARSSIPCSLLWSRIPAPSPQPAGGATGQ